MSDPLDNLGGGSPAPAATSPAERSTQLAADRTVLAAERTYAAWMRTGLAALASGVGAKALLGRMLPLRLATLTGSLLVLFSAFCFFAAVWRDLNFSAAPPKPHLRRLPPLVLLLVSGFMMLIDVGVAAALWLAP